MPKVPSFDLFNNANDYVNVYRMFFAYHAVIPNLKCIREIDNKKFRNKFGHEADLIESVKLENIYNQNQKNI